MSIAAGLLLNAVSAVTAAGTLAGQVVDENDMPIAGALVDIYTAKPRVGLAVTCPSCYRDCAKAAKTDAQGHFVGETTLASDDDGSFLFLNLQPNERYVLYSLCDASQDLPVLKTVSLETGGEGDVTRLGELALLEGLTLAGRVELPTGATMPEGAKLRVSRDPAWDWCEALLTDDGEFEVRSLPPEVYSVSVIAPGYEIDTSRIRYQVTGASEFGLRLRGDGETRLASITVPMKAK